MKGADKSRYESGTERLLLLLRLDRAVIKPESKKQEATVLAWSTEDAPRGE
jgi:hypothetical protein